MKLGLTLWFWREDTTLHTPPRARSLQHWARRGGAAEEPRQLDALGQLRWNLLIWVWVKPVRQDLRFSLRCKYTGWLFGSSIGKTTCFVRYVRFFWERVARVVLPIDDSFCEKCYGCPPYWIRLWALFINFDYRMALCACKCFYNVHLYVSLSTKTYV